MEEKKTKNINKNDGDDDGIVIIDELKYHGFCAKCNYDWDSETKPSVCPKCKTGGIVISENS